MTTESQIDEENEKLQKSTRTRTSPAATVCETDGESDIENDEYCCQQSGTEESVKKNSKSSTTEVESNMTSSTASATSKMRERIDLNASSSMTLAERYLASQSTSESPHGAETASSSLGGGTTETEFSYQLCMARPVRAETFCDCVKFGKEKSCKCGEDDQYFDWVWDDKSKSPASQLIDNCKEVIFHLDYSCGTAAVRGTKQMVKDQYFWEVKMTSPVYGTDMMIGVGTEYIDLNKYQHKFCSLIGQDAESWGLSYTGSTQHRNCKKTYSSKFGQGSIIGAHLDMWRGTLAFYKNRKPLGIAYTGLQGKVLYPMVSSTAARSGMKVITSRSFKTSLQFMCCQTLRRIIPHHISVLDAVTVPPGLREFLYNNISWLLEPCTESTGPENRAVSGEKRKHNMDEDEETWIFKKSKS